MSTFNISDNVPNETKKEILQLSLEQASAEIFRISLDLTLDPDTLGVDWTPDSAGIEEGNSLRGLAELLEFHLKRFNRAKQKLAEL